jgi:ABC-type maltose transport system permease subunit
MYRFEKDISSNKAFAIKVRRVESVYALIPNIAVLWYERYSNIFGDFKERGLHFEWLSFTLTISLQITDYPEDLDENSSDQ